MEHINRRLSGAILGLVGALIVVVTAGAGCPDKKPDIVPIIDELFPTQGPAGTKVALKGRNLFRGEISGRITFNQNGNFVQSQDKLLTEQANLIEFVIPSLPPGLYQIDLVAGSLLSNHVDFTVGPLVGATPVITNITPANGTQAGMRIDIFGTNLPGLNSTVNFFRSGNFVLNTTIILPGSNDKTIGLNLPSTLVSGVYQISLDGPSTADSNQVDYTVGQPVGAVAPVITLITPVNGTQAGTRIDISGTNLPHDFIVYFNQNGKQIASTTQSLGSDAMSVAVNVPAGLAPGVYQVSISDANGVSSNEVNYTIK